MRRVGGLLVYNDRARRKDEARGSLEALRSLLKEKEASAPFLVMGEKKVSVSYTDEQVLL